MLLLNTFKSQIMLLFLIFVIETHYSPNSLRQVLFFSWKLKWAFLATCQPPVSPFLCLLCLFFRTTESISTKLQPSKIKHPWLKGIKVCSNEGSCPFFKGEMKIHWHELILFTQSCILKLLCLIDHKFHGHGETMDLSCTGIYIQLNIAVEISNQQTLPTLKKSKENSMSTVIRKYIRFQLSLFDDIHFICVNWCWKWNHYSKTVYGGTK